MGVLDKHFDLIRKTKKQKLSIKKYQSKQTIKLLEFPDLINLEKPEKIESVKEPVEYESLTLKEAEFELIKAAIIRNNKKTNKVAKDLGVTVWTLRNKVKKYGTTLLELKKTL